jgi:quercetin dioxygenase-like cupin family protein
MKYKSSTEGSIDTKQDYSKRIIFSGADFLEKGHVLQVVTIPPRTKQRKHVHAVQTEVFYILEGETTININDRDYCAKPGDAFICEPEDTHFLWNKTDKEFKLVVFKIHKDERSDDTEWIEQVSESV